MTQGKTLGALRRDPTYRSRGVKDEMRENLRSKLGRGETLFPGVLGYEDTVVPRVVNAILSRHNLILLGLRGQAKSRLLRSLTTLLDDAVPTVAGCEIHDDPFRPLCRRCRDPLQPGEPWDLGHPDADCPRPKAPEHIACNRPTASRAGWGMTPQRERT